MAIKSTGWAKWKYKPCGNCLPQICSKVAATLRKRSDLPCKWGLRQTPVARLWPTLWQSSGQLFGKALANFLAKLWQTFGKAAASFLAKLWQAYLAKLWQSLWHSCGKLFWQSSGKPFGKTVATLPQSCGKHSDLPCKWGLWQTPVAKLWEIWGQISGKLHMTMFTREQHKHKVNKLGWPSSFPDTIGSKIIDTMGG